MADPKPTYDAVYIALHIAFLVCAALAGGVTYLMGASACVGLVVAAATFASLKYWLWWSTK